MKEISEGGGDILPAVAYMIIQDLIYFVHNSVDIRNRLVRDAEDSLATTLWLLAHELFTKGEPAFQRESHKLAPPRREIPRGACNL